MEWNYEAEVMHKVLFELMTSFLVLEHMNFLSLEMKKLSSKIYLLTVVISSINRLN